MAVMSPLSGPTYPTGGNSFNTVFANLQRNVLKGVFVQQAPTLSPMLQCLLQNYTTERGIGQKFMEFAVKPLNITSVLQPTDYRYEWSIQTPATSNVVWAGLNDAKYISQITFYKGELDLYKNNALAPYFDEISVRIAELYQSIIQGMAVALSGVTTVTDFSQFYGIGNFIDNGTNGVTTIEDVSRTTYPWFSAIVKDPSTFLYNGAAIPLYQELVMAQYYRDQVMNGIVGKLRYGFCNANVMANIMLSMTQAGSAGSIERITALDGGREYDIQYIKVGGVVLVVDPYVPANTIYFFNPEDIQLILSENGMFASKTVDITPAGYLDAKSLICMLGGNLVCKQPFKTMKLINVPTMGGF